MVLLHGVASCAHEWDEVARPLAERFRVLALDPKTPKPQNPKTPSKRANKLKNKLIISDIFNHKSIFYFILFYTKLIEIIFNL